MVLRCTTALRSVMRSANVRPLATTRYYSIKIDTSTHSGPHMHGGDPDTIHKEKVKVLKGDSVTYIKTAPGWNEKLASESEAIVKSQQMGYEPPEELQKETLEIQERIRESESQDNKTN